MSKRIITKYGLSVSTTRNCDADEGYNFGKIRLYGNKESYTYAVIIPDDALFEGL